MKFSHSIMIFGLMTSVASAADLPSRLAPLAPLAQPSTQQPFFVGAHVGGREAFDSKDSAQFTVNVRAGYEFSPYARVEASYDWGNDSNAFYRQATVNGVAQYRISSVVPYVVAGIGYRWTDFKDEPVYAVGAGVRYEFVRNFEVDARYRFVSDFNRNRDENIVTVGVNYKF